MHSTSIKVWQNADCIDRCTRKTWKSCSPRTALVHGRTMSTTRPTWVMSHRCTQHNTVHLCRYYNPAQLGQRITIPNMRARRLIHTLTDPVQLLVTTPLRAPMARLTLIAQVHLSQRLSPLVSTNQARTRSAPYSPLSQATQAVVARRA